MSIPAPESEDAYRAPSSDAVPLPLLSVDAPIPAEFGIRFAARLLDVVFLFLIAIASAAFSGALLAWFAQRGWAPDDWLLRIEQTSNGFFGTFLFASVLYHAAGESVGGATLGKLACGLRVWSDDRTACGWYGGTIRNLVFLLDGLFFGAVGYTVMSGSPARQRLGDRWGNTIVVLARSTVPGVAAPSAGVGALASIGVAVAAFVSSFLGRILLVR